MRSANVAARLFGDPSSDPPQMRAAARLQSSVTGCVRQAVIRGYLFVKFENISSMFSSEIIKVCGA
jgi:hypothetical protein